MKRFALFPLTLLFLVACTPTAEQPAVDAVLDVETAVSTEATIPPPVVTVDTPKIEPTTAVAAQPAIEPPTVEPEPVIEEAVEAAAEGGIVYGRTEEGAFFQGDLDAPIVYLDYSDFL
ncbi:hypothetical protein MNBD_CHLOROFLEXI01-1689 [hydrothermal vent metagenome]|uniref:Uncharacterized protein n=1 Tax=hydrothermal vent metagenome TaxID=652676 RepID=A0A3B0VKY5_9ZZZZ